MRQRGMPLSSSTSGLTERGAEVVQQAQESDEPQGGELAPRIPPPSPNGDSQLGGTPSRPSQVVPLPPRGDPTHELPTLPPQLSRERRSAPSAFKTRQTGSFKLRVRGKWRQTRNTPGRESPSREPSGLRDSHSTHCHAARDVQTENAGSPHQQSDSHSNLHSGMVVGFGSIDVRGETETSHDRPSSERTSPESAKHTWRRTRLPFTLGRDLEEARDVRGKRHGGAREPAAFGAGITRAELLRRQSDSRERTACRGLVHLLERLTELVCINDVDFVTIEQGEAEAKRRAPESSESVILDESSGEWSPTDWRSLLWRPMRSRTLSRWSLWGSEPSRRRSQPACRTRWMMSKALLPHNLMFVDPHFEEEFDYNVNRLCAERLTLSSVVFLFVSLCNYSFLLAGVSSGWYLQGRKALITLHVCLALSIALCALFWVASSCFRQWVRQCAEQAIYWLLSGLNLAVISFAISITTILFFDQLEPGEVLPREHPVFKAGPRPPPSAPAPDDKRDTHLVYVLLSVNIVEAVLSSYFFLMVVFLSHVIPGRIGITFWHQLALLLLQAVPTSIGLGRLSILVWPFLIRVVATAVFLLVSLAANVCTEVKRREAFSTWLLVQRTAEANRQISGDARKNSIVSALDRVGSNCREAVTVLEQCKQNVTDIEVKAQITYATDLISDSLELLTRCPNIYASHVDEKLREQSYIQGYQIEPPSAAARGISLHMRAGPQLLRSMTRTRWSQRMTMSSLATGHFSSLLSKAIPLPSQTGRISAALRSGTLISMLELDLQTERRALIEVGYALLKPLVDEWSCEDLVLRNFLWRTDQHYQDTPYHNQIHGAMVAFMMARMINALQVFSESQILALTATRLASLCHDVGHPGRNNAFLTSTSHLASIIYNDSSILENFHAALTFRILSSEDSNIVENTAPEFYRSVRALMIDLILATDMKSHFDFVTRVRTRRKSPEFNVLQNIEDQCLMSEACMRAADIGHGLVNWEEHYEWSMRVTVEFYLQGDEEKRLGLPTSPLCDRDQASQLPKSQVGFLTYVVLPLIVELQPADESNAFISSLLANLTSNATKWESLQGKEVEKPASFSRFDQRLRGHDMQLDVTLLTRKEVP